MPRKALPPPCTDKDSQTLKEWANSRSMEARLVERARMICDLKVRPTTVRNHFALHGIAGLSDRPRSGKPPKYG